jgi:flavin-dependent dehydrogenase
MKRETAYDTAIIGGGLAGLCLSIQLAQQGFKIILFEKESYPFHKVCGEYISMESYDFLKRLGLRLDEMQLPFIKRLVVTSPAGTALEANLDLGGFGISRYKIDNDLKDIAEKNNVTILQNCKVEDVQFADESFTIFTSEGNFTAKTCCGSFGKKSNLDIKWKRPFAKAAPNKLNNFIGIKYHVIADMPADTIALHNFKNGYCGISKIEDDKYCVCYLTNAANLKESNNSIDEMEKNILSVNPHLKNIFVTAKKVYSTPLSISQISFQKKSQVEDHVLLIGDAAGMITPLCGNGMSMAMHGSKIAAECITAFLQNISSRQVMEKDYERKWKNNFAKRLRAGRIVQSFFGKESSTNIFINIMKRIPFVTKNIIKATHGKPF